MKVLGTISTFGISQVVLCQLCLLEKRKRDDNFGEGKLKEYLLKASYFEVLLTDLYSRYTPLPLSLTVVNANALPTGLAGSTTITSYLAPPFS